MTATTPLLREVGGVHPDQLLLVADVVAHEGVGAFVFGFGGKLEELTFERKEHLIAGQDAADGFLPIGNAFADWHRSNGRKVLISMQWREAQGQDTLGDLIDLVGVKAGAYPVDG